MIKIRINPDEQKSRQDEYSREKKNFYMNKSIFRGNM